MSNRNSFLPYWGGKATLAPTIISLLPKTMTYVEPFIGGGAVLFNKSRSEIEVINDKDSRIVDFYRVLQTRFDEFYEKVKVSLYSEYLYGRAREIWRNGHEDEVERAWATWFIIATSYFNSADAGFKKKVSTKDEALRFLMNKETIELCKKRIERVIILNQDVLDVIKDFDSPDTVFYLDPPYMEADQKQYAGYTEADFEALLKALEKTHSKFLLSHYPNDMLMDYSERNNWNVYKKDMFLNANWSTKTEVLVYNYALPQATLFD